MRFWNCLYSPINSWHLKFNILTKNCEKQYIVAFGRDSVIYSMLLLNSYHKTSDLHRHSYGCQNEVYVAFCCYIWIFGSNLPEILKINDLYMIWNNVLIILHQWGIHVKYSPHDWLKSWKVQGNFGIAAYVKCFKIL